MLHARVLVLIGINIATAWVWCPRETRFEPPLPSGPWKPARLAAFVCVAPYPCRVLARFTTEPASSTRRLRKPELLLTPVRGQLT